MSDKQLSILVMDDEPFILESIADYLEDFDYLVFSAENGRVGLECFENEKPDVILTDLRMPEFDGLEVLRIVRERSPDTPIIVMSATGRIADSVHALRLGAWNYILKPIEDMSIITHAIDKALERARLIIDNRLYQENLEALVAERTLKLEEAQRKISLNTQRLSALVELGSMEKSSEAEIIQFVLEEAVRLTKSDFGLFHLYDQKNKIITASSHSKGKMLEDIEFPRFPYPLEEAGVWANSIRWNKPQILNNTLGLRYIKKSSNSSLVIKRHMSVPINTSSFFIAVAEVNNKKEPYDESDAQQLTLLLTGAWRMIRKRRTEAALRRSEEKYRIMMEALNDAAYVCTSGFQVEYMNQAMINRLECDATGQSCHNVMEILGGKCTWCPHKNIKWEGHSSIEMVTPEDGRIYHVSNSPIYDADGSISKNMTILRDITEIRGMEKHLQQAQKMETIGLLAGGIAHDFNNILGGILGFAELLEEDLKQIECSDKIIARVATIIKGSVRAKELVAQILAFSRERGESKEPLNLTIIAKEVVKLLSATLPTTIKIKKSFYSNQLILAEATKIHQLLMNLCTNAAHAMKDERGGVSVSIADIDLDEDMLSGQEMVLPGPFLYLSVEDTGHGMDENTLRNILKPFFSTKPEGEGTGMGLWVVDEIVRDMGGFLKIKSELARGTKFDIFLPVFDPEIDQSKARLIGVEGSFLGTEHILFVDDEKTLTQLAKEYLTDLGYKVTVFNSSLEALDDFEINHKTYDLLITDLTMPEMTGDSLCLKVKEIAPEIEVILASGVLENVDESTLDMFDAVMQKPILIKDMAKTIRLVIDESKY